jgi:hypothetical protein
MPTIRLSNTSLEPAKYSKISIKRDKFQVNSSRYWLIMGHPSFEKILYFAHYLYLTAVYTFSECIS